MKLLTNNMLGRQYPFFLGNKRLGSNYYLYQLYSPGISADFFPTVSLRKISERISPDVSEPQGKGIDLLAVASGVQNPSKNISRVLDWLQKGYQFPDAITFTGDNFPELEMDPFTLNVQKNLIILLRDSIRWNKHRFFDGRLVDVLWDKDHFIVCQVHSSGGSLGLEPVSMHYISDVNLTRPLPYPNLKSLPEALRGKEFKEVGNGKSPGLCQALKKVEWDSFDRGCRRATLA